VHPGAVQEHGGEHVLQLAAGIGEADDPLAHREAGAGGQRPGELAGYEAELADRAGEGSAAPAPWTSTQTSTLIAISTSVT
jgi:hypothetical protein